MKTKDTNIAVLGDGGWGTTLALLLAGKGFHASLWGAFPEYVEEVRRTRVNRKFLPGFKIPGRVNLTADLRSACAEADLIVLAIPSQHLRSVVKKIGRAGARGKAFVSVCKGIESGSLQTMSQVVHEELGRVRICVLSGPTIARDVALKHPAAVSVASKDRKLRAQVRETFATDTFSLFESDDVLGVELGGSIKNVIAIGSGIVQGLDYGSNTQAVLFARGLNEMARLGMKMGARRETFMGLSGLGDLATTCLSPISRNRSLGEAIGKGRTLKQILSKTEMVVEGVDTCRSTYRLAKKLRVPMPITAAVHGILFGGRNPRAAVDALMKPSARGEHD